MICLLVLCNFKTQDNSIPFDLCLENSFHKTEWLFTLLCELWSAKLGVFCFGRGGGGPAFVDESGDMPFLRASFSLTFLVTVFKTCQKGIFCLNELARFYVLEYTFM